MKSFLLSLILINALAAPVGAASHLWRKTSAVAGPICIGTRVIAFCVAAVPIGIWASAGLIKDHCEARAQNEEALEKTTVTTTK